MGLLSLSLKENEFFNTGLQNVLNLSLEEGVAVIPFPSRRKAIALPGW